MFRVSVQALDTSVWPLDISACPFDASTRHPGPFMSSACQCMLARRTHGISLLHGVSNSMDMVTSVLGSFGVHASFWGIECPLELCVQPLAATSEMHRFDLPAQVTGTGHGSHRVTFWVPVYLCHICSHTHGTWLTHCTPPMFIPCIQVQIIPFKVNLNLFISKNMLVTLDKKKQGEHFSCPTTTSHKLPPQHECKTHPTAH